MLIIPNSAAGVNAGGHAHAVADAEADVRDTTPPTSNPVAADAPAGRVIDCGLTALDLGIPADRFPPNPVRDAAAVLRSRGFAICKPDPETKCPTSCGWSARSSEPHEFGPLDQIGVVAGPLSNGGRPGHALVVVDLDHPDAVRLADEYLPPTGMVAERPGKPAAHRYFLVPVDTIPPEASSTAEQGAPAAQELTGHPGPAKKAFNLPDGTRLLDFLGTGGQAVAPPSVWTSEDGTRTETRRWVGGEPGEPAVVGFADLWAACCRLAEACGCVPPPWCGGMPRPTPSTSPGPAPGASETPCGGPRRSRASPSTSTATGRRSRGRAGGRICFASPAN